MNKMVSAKDLARIEGRSTKTHIKYSKLGWIDPPIKCVTTGKKGTALYWKRSVLSRLALISTMKQLGKTDIEITKMLKEGN